MKKEIFANLAARHIQKKPTKNQALYCLLNLAAELPEEHAPAIANLYAHFLPSTPAKPKTPLDWIYKAVPKNLSDSCHRPHLLQAYYEDGYLIGTDGHRMHIVKQPGLSKGYIDRTGTQVDKGDTFPNWKAVSTTENKTSLPLAQVVIGSNINPKTNEPVTVLTVPTGTIYLNDKYWNDALCLSDPENVVVWFDAEQTELGRVVLTDSVRGTTAVVMPLRM